MNEDNYLHMSRNYSFPAASLDNQIRELKREVEPLEQLQKLEELQREMNRNFGVAYTPTCRIRHQYLASHPDAG